MSTKIDWTRDLRIARIYRNMKQRDLAEACAEHNKDSGATWEQLLVHIENGRAIPTEPYRRILEEVLGETVPNLGAYVPNLGTEKEER